MALLFLISLKTVWDIIYETVNSSQFFIWMLLFGYTAFMKQIGANQMTVRMLSRPLLHLKYKALLLPLFYLIGNVLGLIIPSASSFICFINGHGLSNFSLSWDFATQG